MAVMNPAAAKTWDMLRLVGRGGPAVCNIAVTNSCYCATWASLQ